MHRFPDRTRITEWLRAGLHVLRGEGTLVLLRELGSTCSRYVEEARADYPGWVRIHGSARDAGDIARRVGRLPSKPPVSIITPVFDPPEPLLRAAIDSVLRQDYGEWELCLADDGSTEPHVRRVLEEYRARDARIRVVFRERTGGISAASNSALQIASGEWVAFLDHDDELAPDALLAVAEEIERYPDAAIVYSDEDKLDFRGAPAHPHFKPDWNYDLFLCYNLLAHLCVYRTTLVRALGGLREGFEGAQDYDLALRAIEQVEPAQIRHIPRVLYHWRMVLGSTAVNALQKDYAAQRRRAAVREHLERVGAPALVETFPLTGDLRIRHPLEDPPPAFELIAENGANLARLRNEAARASTAEFLVFLGPGIEPSSPEALEELVSQARRPHVGAVAGKVVDARGRIVHAGVLLGAGHAHRGRRRGDRGYMGRAALVQSMPGVSGDCLCIRRELFLEAGGFDEALGAAFHDIDLCLRLLVMGRRNVFTPFAEFRCADPARISPAYDAACAARHPGEASILRVRWAKLLEDDPSYNPNLSLAKPFALARPARLRVPTTASSMHATD